MSDVPSGTFISEISITNTVTILYLSIQSSEGFSLHRIYHLLGYTRINIDVLQQYELGAKSL